MNNKKRTVIVFLVIICMIGTSVISGIAGGIIANKYIYNNKAAGVTSTEIPVADSSNSKNKVMSVSKVVKAVRNSVVSIECEVEDNSSYYFGGSSTSTSAGSGVIITTNGYIITNNHVVDGAKSIKVQTADEKSYDAKLIGTDSQTDIAVLKINAKGLTTATFGKSSTLNVGDEVVAIGNPLGTLSGTVTNGIVSALDREVTINNESMSLIQTNASINSGNSGGGMFDKDGLLVGIVNAKASGDSVEGLGFAIPIDDVKEVVEQLMDNGKVTGRVTSGLTLLDISDETTASKYGVDETGVYIYSVSEGSNAEKAGLESGYKIISINGTEVNTASQFKKVIKNKKAGTTIKVKVKRTLGTKTFSYKLETSK